MNKTPRELLEEAELAEIQRLLEPDPWGQAQIVYEDDGPEPWDDFDGSLADEAADRAEDAYWRNIDENTR